MFEDLGGSFQLGSNRSYFTQDFETSVQYLLGPISVIGFKAHSRISKLKLHSETSAQVSWHQITLYNFATVWVDQIAFSIDVKTNKGHWHAVMVEKYVRVWTVEYENKRERCINLTVHL